MRIGAILLAAITLHGPAFADARSGVFGGRTVAFEQRLERIDLPGADGKAEATLVAPAFVASRPDPHRP